jgi:hypothetical protein
MSAKAKVSQPAPLPARTNGRKQTRKDDFRHMPLNQRRHMIAA